MAAACEKDTEATTFAPQVTTGTATDVYRMSATLSGKIVKTDATPIERFGILLSEFPSMAESKELNSTMYGDGGDFEERVENLEPNKVYYFCAYAYSGHSTVRGEIRSFSTSESSVPILGEIFIEEVTETSITLSATINDNGGSEIIMSGFCYAEGYGKVPTLADMTKNTSDPNNNHFSVTITGLTPGTYYQIRGYAASEYGVGYSRMLDALLDARALPVVSNITCQDSTFNSITVAASITYTGSTAVTDAGFCYSSWTEPDISDNTISLGAPNGSFSALIDGLTTGDTYYIRAYAKNDNGTSYSDTYVYTPTNPEDETPTINDMPILGWE